MGRTLVALIVAILTIAAESGAARAVPNLSGTGEALRCTDGTALGNDELETTIVRDPRDDRRLVAAWVQGERRAVVTAHSTDGGRTWQRAVVDGVTACGGGDLAIAFNPSLAYAPDGTLYLVATASAGTWEDLEQRGDPGVARARIVATTSLDGGSTWATPVTVAPNEAANDYPRITTDPDGTAFVSWKTSVGAAEATVVAVSHDRGTSWSEPRPARFSTPGHLVLNRLHAYPDGGVALVTVEWPLPDFVAPQGPTRARVHVSYLRPAGALWEHSGAVGEVAALSIGSTVDGEGVLHLALPRRTGSGIVLAHRSSRDRGRSWDGDALVVGLPDRHRPPSIAVDGQGTVAIVTGTLGDDSEIHLLRKRGGRPWAGRTLAPTGSLTAPNPEYVRADLAPHAVGFTVIGLVASPQALDGSTDVLVWREP